MITIRYIFENGEFIATLYLDDEPVETRTFNYRDHLNRWAHSEGCTTIEKEPSNAS